MHEYLVIDMEGNVFAYFCKEEVLEKCGDNLYMYFVYKLSPTALQEVTNEELEN